MLLLKECIGEKVWDFELDGLGDDGLIGNWDVIDEMLCSVDVAGKCWTLDGDKVVGDNQLRTCSIGFCVGWSDEVENYYF